MTHEQIFIICTLGGLSWIFSVLMTACNCDEPPRQRARLLLLVLILGWAALPIGACYVPFALGRWVGRLWKEAELELPALPRPRLFRRAPELGAGQLSTAPDEPGQLSLPKK